MDKDNMVLDYEGSWALLYTDLSFQAMGKYHQTQLNFKNTFSISIGKNRYYHVYINRADLLNNQEKIKSFFYNNEKVLELVRDIGVVLSKMSEYADYSANSNAEMFSKYCDICEEYLLYYNSIFCSKLYDEAWSEIKKSISKEYMFAVNDIEKALISTNDENLLTYKELKNWICLCEKYLTGNLSDHDLIIHRNSFLSLHSSKDEIERFTLPEISKKIKSTTTYELSSLKVRFNNMYNSSMNSNEWSYNTYARVIKDNNYQFIRNISLFANLRLLMREKFHQFKLLAKKKFLDQVINTINRLYGFEAFDYLLSNEILAFINDKKLPSSAVIESRINSNVFVFEEGKILFEDISGRFSKMNFSNKMFLNLKGTVVSGSGQQTFIVKKIIQNFDDISEMVGGLCEDNIYKYAIVTNTIRPHILYQYMNVGALVLTEGGITSHAAILCRNLGIPCLIGVEGAITVLEDDQKIKIDFSSGNIGIVHKTDANDNSKTNEALFTIEDEMASIPNIVGGKASNLNRIVKFANVPKGFIISKLATNIINSNNQGKQQKLMQQIINHINDLNVDNIIIRSSHVLEDQKKQSYAGVFESYTDIPANDHLMIFDTIQKVLSSSQRVECAEHSNMAIIVQEMIQSELSGVVISSHTEDGYDYMIIEYVFGKLEALMRGIIQPFRVFVKKIDIMRGGKLSQLCVPSLVNSSYTKIFDDLGEVALQIEQNFLSPVEIEWGVKEGTLYVFQAREY